MARTRFIADLSFRTKMLVAVTIVMSLLVALSLWLVSQRFKQQIHANAAEQLRTAEGVLKIRQQTRDVELALRFTSVKNEPRLKAAAIGLQEEKALWTATGQRTMRLLLEDLIKAGMADVIAFTPAPDLGRSISAARDPQFNADQFSERCANSIRQAFASQPNGVDIVESGGRLFEVVTLPVLVSDNLAGTITFGVEDSMAREFAQLMRKDNDLVLLLDNRVVASTLRDASVTELVPKKFATLAAQVRPGADMQEIVLGDEHFWGLAGWLSAQGQPDRLAYLILSSYEKPLQELRATQRMILLIGLLAIFSGIAVVWFLVRKITEPLRELQISAAAVGRGDFSRRVDIRSRDEFGGLGRAFNQMTQDIEQAQAKLRQTVETLKTTQAQLIQSEKLSAVGEFVAGVAHELNNPLATVMGFSEILKDTNTNEKHRRHLDLIFKSAQRCQKIVQSLLSFARQQPAERKPVLVHKLIEEVLDIVAYPLRTSNVQVATQFAPRLPFVLADGHQIQQVILNLINNARQAIEEHQDSGRIVITTSADEKTVRIVIQDNGPGISSENLRRIFDPFFTTKEVGKGTGLGLSLCYGMIHEHGGHISAASRPGEGATFTIELPVEAIADVALENTGETSASNTGAAKEGVGKKVLLIDDEEMLLEMIRDDLQRHGYEVIIADGGESALRAMHGQNVDMICCDLKMPGLNGRQVYDWIRNARPELSRRMIFMTGDIINEALQKFFDQEKIHCLNKPFALGELRRILKMLPVGP